MSQNMIAAEKLFLVADKSKLVREGDESAAFLYATPGDEIPADAAEMFGLVDGKLPEEGEGKSAAKPKKAAETKPAAAAENKEAGQ